MIKPLTVVLLLAAITIGFFAYIDQPKHWVYDPAKLHEISRTAVKQAAAKYEGNATAAQVVELTIKGVLEAYPETTRSTGRWLWNNAGGAMGSMTVLHCSFSEYLIIFGTAVGTEGHTGRHFADDFFNILYGEQWAAAPGPGEREVFKPGDMNLMPRNVARQYRMPDACFALEYARGNIASMMFFGIADILSSTLDFVTGYQTFVESAGNMIPNLLRGKL